MSFETRSLILKTEFASTWTCWFGGKAELERVNQGWCSRESCFLQETRAKNQYLSRIDELRILLMNKAQDVRLFLTQLPSFFYLFNSMLIREAVRERSY